MAPKRALSVEIRLEQKFWSSGERFSFTLPNGQRTFIFTVYRLTDYCSKGRLEFEWGLSARRFFPVCFHVGTSISDLRISSSPHSFEERYFRWTKMECRRNEEKTFTEYIKFQSKLSELDNQDHYLYLIYSYFIRQKAMYVLGFIPIFNFIR